jgi:hypothetical protein
LNFDTVGIPGSHHSNMGAYGHLNRDDMKQAAAIIAAFVYNTAMRPEMMPQTIAPTRSALCLTLIFRCN